MNYLYRHQPDSKELQSPNLYPLSKDVNQNKMSEKKKKNFMKTLQTENYLN